MTFTYAGDPAASDLAELRFTIQDTDANDAQFSDEELDFLLTTYGSVLGAAIAACQTLVAKYARQSNESKKVGDLSLSKSLGDVSSQYAALLAQLKAQRMTLFPPTPVVNANALVPTVDRDQTDLPGTDFALGQMDNET